MAGLKRAKELFLRHIFLKREDKAANNAQITLTEQLQNIESQHDKQLLTLTEINKAVHDIKTILSETGQHSRRGRSETLEALLDKLND